MQGILMLEILYRQTLAGLKTQTRRENGFRSINEKHPESYKLNEISFHGKKPTAVMEKKMTGQIERCNSRYNIGDIVYIKEPNRTNPQTGEIEYKYDLPEDDKLGWGNKMFASVESGRAFIKITGIKVERIFDISDEDCIAEGINKMDIGGNIHYQDYMGKTRFSSVDTPKDSFFSLFRLAANIAKHKPLLNKWVFVYAYEYLPDYQKPTKDGNSD